MILEPKKIKSANISTFPLSICHEVIGPDAMILVFFSLSNSLAVQWFGICGLDPAVGWVWSLVWELRLKNLQATRRGPPTPHLISLIWLEHGMKLGSWGDRSAPRLRGGGFGLVWQATRDRGQGTQRDCRSLPGTATRGRGVLESAQIQPRPAPEGVCCGEDKTYLGARGLRGLWGSGRYRESTKPWWCGSEPSLIPRQ